MDELIYSFLLQSDYPRASIIIDLDLMGQSPPVDSGLRRPSFTIVDPDTADLLAVIDVVDAIDDEALRQVSIETGAYASRMAGRTIQGFVIRVDVRGRTEDEQVQFYRIWPNSTLQQLSSKSFPDLESLKVARKLVLANMATTAKAAPAIVEVDEKSIDVVERGAGVGMYFPAFILLILMLADGFFALNRGTPFLSVSQGILAFGAALLFTLPAAIRYIRR